MLNAQAEGDTRMPQSQEKQTILFLPGVLNDARLYDAQIAALTAQGHDCRAFAVDYAETMEGLAQGALERAGLLDGDGPFSIVAMSMGGYVAFEIIRQLQARGQMERVQRLALLNTSARPDTPVQRENRERMMRLSQTGTFRGVTPRLLPQLLAPASLENAFVTGTIMAMAESVGQAGFVRQQQAILSRADYRPLLPQLAIPALVVGGVYDKLSTPEVVMEIARGIPNTQFHLLDNCGHVSPLEQADVVMGLLLGLFG